MKRISLILLVFSMFLVACREKGKAPVAGAPVIPVAPFAAFAEGLINDITPEGWVREILQRQKDGLTGHPEAMSYPFDSCCWAGDLEMSKNTTGVLTGGVSSSPHTMWTVSADFLVLDDEELWPRQANVDYVLDHPLPPKPGYVFDESIYRGFGSARDPRSPTTSRKGERASRRAQIEKRKITLQDVLKAVRPKANHGLVSQCSSEHEDRYEATGDQSSCRAREELPHTLRKNQRDVISSISKGSSGRTRGNPKLLELAEAVGLWFRGICSST